MPGDLEAVRNTRDVVDLVVSSDPMAARIGSRERGLRLGGNFSYAKGRLGECLAQQGGESSAADERLQNELLEFEGRLRRSAPLDQDTIESGVDLIDRVERRVVERCGPPTPVDRALLLLARQHEVDSR
jgi:hypothetical protein